MTGKYILVGHEAVEEPDLLKWAAWYETANLRVALDVRGPWTVSTAFLSLDFNVSGKGPPHLFETTVFHSGRRPNVVNRCSTWAEAAAGHALMVEKIEKTLADERRHADNKGA